MDAETAADAEATGITIAAETTWMAETIAAEMIMTTVAVTIIAAQDVAMLMTTGIGTMTTTGVAILLLPGLEAITPTGTPADVKSSKESAGTYVSALCTQRVLLVCSYYIYNYFTGFCRNSFKIEL